MGTELFHANGRTDGQTDRLDEANSRFSQFCERVYRPRLLYIKVIRQWKQYSVKCPGILPNTNKLSYKVIDHGIYIRW